MLLELNAKMGDCEFFKTNITKTPKKIINKKWYKKFIDIQQIYMCVWF